MNKRRKAQIFSLLLAFLMLASVIPGTFLKPVSAGPTIAIESADFYLNQTSNSVSKPFVGYPANLSVNVSGNLNFNFQILVYYNESGILVKKASSGLINIGDDGWEVVDFSLPAIPKNATHVVIKAQVVDIVDGQLGVVTEDVEVVEVSNNVVTGYGNVNIVSTVPYNASGTPDYSKAFKNIPFNLTLEVDFNDTLVSGYPGLLPNETELKAYLYAGSNKIAEGIVNTSLATAPNDYFINFTNVKTSYVGNLTLILHDTKHDLTYTIPLNESGNAVTVYDWWLNVTYEIHGNWANPSVNGVIKLVPFNVTFNITSNSSVGKLLLNATGTFNLEGASEATPMSGTFNLTNGFNQTTIYNVSADPLVVTFSLPDYGVERTVEITVYDWQINVDADIYIYDNTSEPYNLTSDESGYGFYKDIPATMLVKFNYTNTTLGLIDINSNATVEVYYGDQLIWSNNSVPVTNGEGQIFVNLTNVSFVPDDATKKIRVVVKDNNYAKWGDKDITVYDWGVNADLEDVYIFGNSTWSSDHFTKNIPANFTFRVSFERYDVFTEPVHDACGCVIGYENVTEPAGALPFVPKTQLNVTVQGPGVDEWFILNVTGVNKTYSISKLITFTDTGEATITVTDTEYGRSDSFTVDIEEIDTELGNYVVYSFGTNVAHCKTIDDDAFYAHVPANLTYDIYVGFPIEEAYVNVTLVGPDATYGPFEYYVNTTNGGLDVYSDYSIIHLNVSKLMQFNESGEVKFEWEMLIFANHSTYNTTIEGGSYYYYGWYNTIDVEGWPVIHAAVGDPWPGGGDHFYIGVPDDLHIKGYYNFPFPANANITVHVTGPNYDKWINKTITYEKVCEEGYDFSDLFHNDLYDLQFNETGKVTVDWEVTYWDDSLNLTPFTVSDVETFEVEPWYVQFEVSPDSLTVGEDAFLGINVGVFPNVDVLRDRMFNITVELPNGQNFTATAYGAWNDMDAYIKIPAENITVPGVAKITVADESGLVKAVQYIPVYPNVQYNKKYIDVKVTPEETYKYQTVNLTIDLQYMGVSGNWIYPIDADSMAQVVVYSGDEVVYNETIPMHNNNGHVTITGVAFDAVGPITVEVKDLTDSSIAGAAAVEVKPWDVDVTFEPQKVYKYIPVNLSVVATPNVPAISEDDLRIYVNGELYTGEEFEFLPLEDTNFTVAVYYVSDFGNEYLMYNETYTVKVLDWGIEVDTHPLYVHPQFENSLKFPFRYVDENGDLVPFTGKANVTLVLPDGQNFTGAFDVVNGEGVIDFGKAVISETGNATLTVAQFIGDYNVTKEVEIPVDDLVTITKVEPTTIYADVPTEIKVYVHSGANDYENITVTLNGKKLKYLGSGVYAENFTLAAGNYTITVYDSIYNVTTTENITVEGWHLVMSVTPDEFTAATLRTITIEVKAVLDRNESIIAKIDDVFTGVAAFDDVGLYPIETEFTVEMEEGVGTTTIQLYAPDEGNYTISGKDEYNKTAEVTIPVSAPDLSKLAWVYVTIKKEGTLESPNETTVIYVAFNNREGPYVPAYDFVNHKSVSGTTEAVFPLAPVEKFSLYVIALPLEIAKDVPYIEDISNFTKTWDVPKTYYEVTPEVTRVDEITWNITVEVDGNVTVYTYTYKPPMAPGVIPIEPQASSVWGNAIYTPVTKEISEVTPLEGFSETIKLTPTLEVERVTPIDIQPAKEGSYFELLAKLYVENAEEQFEQLFSERVVPKVQAMDFLEESEKENLISELKEMAGNVSTANGPLAGKTIEFHIDNEAIAYVEPTNTTTDENGTATFKVYSKAKVGMTPDELLTLMGAVNVWATYDDVTSNTLTVKFGGVGSIAGIVMDENNNPVAGVEVVLYTFNGTEWVPAVDYNGNVLKAVTDVHGRYEIDGIPALPPLSIYRAVALVADTPAGFAEAAVSPFQTSPVNIVITAEGTEATGLGAFLSDAQSHDVKFVTGSNIFNPDYYAKDFLVEYIGAKPVYTDKSINVEALTEKDMIIAIGGPSVNSITAHYQEMAPVKMVTNDDGSISIIVDNETVANWTAPSPWWNVSKGYWVVQRVVDPDTGAVVYMIYGTDADSTWAAAYYFSEHFGELQGKDYVIGYWEDTDGQIFGDALKFASDDNNGFSPTDEIGVIVEG
ncbi:hypothetical protein X802_05965 [Thermococcus guaymasensis DSM 11113]|uniref:Uncharacterized protein n=1 Tax=Thermococcus guaymasensis DSM 11113 TaxID=1432656 RepID=A0A0X1KNF0_9EURY|nr:hypothetical protein [Thermococcus guaymasensis]AJC72740.1 hypothetical protein X802_05965 [Thermococcus guaymasensis DSM 11113]